MIRLTVFQQPLIARVVTLGLAGLISGGLVMLTGTTFGYVMAGISIVLFGGLAGYYAVAPRTTLTFEHGGQKRTCRVVARRAKIDRFVHRFSTAVKAA